MSTLSIDLNYLIAKFDCFEGFTPTIFLQNNTNIYIKYLGEIYL